MWGPWDGERPFRFHNRIAGWTQGDQLSRLPGGFGSGQRHVHPHLRLAVDFGIEDRHAEEGWPIVTAAVIVNEFRALFDLVIFRLVRVIDTVGTMHRVIPMPSWTDV